MNPTIDSSYASLSSFVPYSVIKAAEKVNVEAIHLVLKHYDAYMNKLALRFVYDVNGLRNKVVDPYIHRRLETKLITAVLKFL